MKLSGALKNLMDELQLGPRAKRLAGLISDQSISDAVQRSVEAARKVRASAWTDLKEEIRLLPKIDFRVEVSYLRLVHPELFTIEELQTPAEGLIARVAAAN